MHNIKEIRENFDVFKQNLLKRNVQVNFDEIINLDKKNRELINIKETLLTKQNGRCHACSNFIMIDDLHHTKLKYKTPLQNGGLNNPENIGLLCPNCFGFS